MNGDQQAALRRHNTRRSELGIHPLIWSWHLAEHAQERADEIAKSEDAYNIDVSITKGENVIIYCSSHPGDPLEEATRLWHTQGHAWHQGYGRIAKRGLGKVLFNEYTQAIWENTTHIGMATTTRGRATVVVAWYWPSGNCAGEEPYMDRSKATIDVEERPPPGHEGGSKDPKDTKELLPETGECSDSEVARWFLQ